MVRRGNATSLHDTYRPRPRQAHPWCYIKWHFPEALSVIWHDDPSVQAFAKDDAIAHAKASVAPT
eukprot:5155539-Lingulodinium_polyedra.AAC.1